MDESCLLVLPLGLGGPILNRFHLDGSGHLPGSTSLVNVAVLDTEPSKDFLNRDLSSAMTSLLLRADGTCLPP